MRHHGISWLLFLEAIVLRVAKRSVKLLVVNIKIVNISLLDTAESTLKKKVILAIFLDFKCNNNPFIFLISPLLEKRKNCIQIS